MTQYRALESETIVLQFEGDSIDVLSVAAVHLGVQLIAEKIAYDLLQAANVRTPRWHEPTSIWDANWLNSTHLIRLDVREAKTGTITCELAILALANVLSDPNIAAILNGVASNLIYALATSPLKWVLAKLKPGTPMSTKIDAMKGDFYNVTSVLEAIGQVFVQDQPLKRVHLTVESTGTVTFDAQYYRKRR